MIDCDDYTCFFSAGLVIFTMKHDLYERDAVAAAADTLKKYVRKIATRSNKAVPVLIDLRKCKDFAVSHICMTVSILVGERDALLEFVSASAVLMEIDSTMEMVRGALLSMYTPVRPFGMFAKEAESREFLLPVKDPKPMSKSNTKPIMCTTCHP